MKIQTIRLFYEDYNVLPQSVQDRADKQFSLLLSNLPHPSLRLKKIKEPPNIWEGRITENHRCTFQIVGETYLLRRIGTHPILKAP